MPKMSVEEAIKYFEMVKPFMAGDGGLPHIETAIQALQQQEVLVKALKLVVMHFSIRKLDCFEEGVLEECKQALAPFQEKGKNENN